LIEVQPTPNIGEHGLDNRESILSNGLQNNFKNNFAARFWFAWPVKSFPQQPEELPPSAAKSLNHELRPMAAIGCSRKSRQK